MDALGHVNNLEIVSELNIGHLIGTLSFVVVYIDEEYRGNGVFKKLAQKHIKENSTIKTLSILFMANNKAAIMSYKKYEFAKFSEITSNTDSILRLLLDNRKILLTKTIK